MAKNKKKKRPVSLRLWVQICFTALTNGYATGFAKGKIYTGPGKKFCLPGLNCYSCPGALGSCPIDSLQAVLGDRNYNFAFYVIGFLILVGALAGRFVCGWLCPFGLVQNLLYKIPFPKKLKKLPGDKILKICDPCRLCDHLTLDGTGYCRSRQSLVLQIHLSVGHTFRRYSANCFQPCAAISFGLAFYMEICYTGCTDTAVGYRVSSLL